MNYELTPVWKTRVPSDVIINRETFDKVHPYIVYDLEGYELRFSSYACARTTALHYRREEVIDTRNGVIIDVWQRFR